MMAVNTVSLTLENNTLLIIQTSGLKRELIARRGTGQLKILITCWLGSQPTLKNN